MTMRCSLAVVLVWAFLASSAFAQREAPAPAPRPDYTYAAEARRDPFVRTPGRLAAPALNLSVRLQGVAGLLVSEVVVRGFLESRGTWVALVGAPDGRSYTVRPGDRLMDGVIRAITPDGVTILQDVTDSLSPVKQREVRKSLRGGDQVK